jgi:microcystin-dependent protein
MGLIHTIFHKFVSGKADGTDATVVRPSNWNDDHDVTFETDGNTILGRQAGAAGPVQALTLGGEFTITGGVISVVSAFPIGVILDYGGSSAPNGWLMCYGQLVLRADFPDLFDVIGEHFGAGDGFSTFGIPDARGRVLAGRDGMGGVAANRLTNDTMAPGGGNTLGASGGTETHVLVVGELPVHSHTGTTELDGVHTHTLANTESPTGIPPSILAGQYITQACTNSDNRDYALNGTGTLPTVGKTSDSSSHTHVIPADGSDDPHLNVQPTLVVTKIIFTGVFT